MVNWEDSLIFVSQIIKLNIMGTRSLTTFIETYEGKNKIGKPITKKNKIFEALFQFSQYLKQKK